MSSFDKEIDRGYDVDELNYFKEDLEKLFTELPKKYTEHACGFRRADVLLEALRQRIPDIYTGMMSRYQS